MVGRTMGKSQRCKVRNRSGQKRWLWYAPIALLASVTALVVFYGCGGGGGGGGTGGGGQRPTTFQGANGLRNFAQQNGNAAAQFNNASQASRLTNRYLNQQLAQNIRQSPHDALVNTVNQLGRMDQLRNLLQQRPSLRNALQFRDSDNDNFPDDSDNDNVPDELSVNFDNLTPDDEGVLIGTLPRETNFAFVSWRQGLKLFRGRCKITDPKPGDANQPQQEVKVECDSNNPVQVYSPEPGRPKLKLLGAFKERVPRGIPQGQQQVQAEIDFDGLTVEDLETRDEVRIGKPEKEEWSPVQFSIDDPNFPLAWDFSGIDWNGVDIAWLDDDMLQLASEDLAELEWTLDSNGSSQFAVNDCFVPIGADWTFQPVPRSRRQAELLEALLFNWSDTPTTDCGALTFDVSIPDLNIRLDDLPEEGWSGWVDETDSELDAYLASLLNLPPGAELADAVLRGEGFTTGLPQFMHDFVLGLHTQLAPLSRPQGVQIMGDYPSNYTATFTGQRVEIQGETFTLSGQAAFQFQESPLSISVTFTNFSIGESKVTLNGALAMTLGQLGSFDISATNFRWAISDEQSGSANGRMSASLTFQNGVVSQVVTSQMNLSLSVTDQSVTPPQSYSATLTVVQPLRWPVKDCDFSVEGVLRVQGQIADQNVDMQIDFGADGACEKAKITSGGRSAIYNLVSGLFEELSRLRGRLRVLQMPERKPIRFSRHFGAAL